MGKTFRGMKRNHSTRTPRKVIFLDTETVREPFGDNGKWNTEVFRLGCAIQVEYRGGERRWRREHRLNSQDDFWNLIFNWMNDGPTVWVFAHKCSFDASVIGLWDKIDQGLLQITRPNNCADDEDSEELEERGGILSLRDPPFICDFWNAKGKTRWVSTLNYFPSSLKKLGESIGYHKGEVDFDTVTDDELYNYCRKDTEIIERAMTDLFSFWASEDHGVFQCTSSGLAMASFRHKFMKHDFYVTQDLEENNRQREAYYGGRGECFYVGKIVHESELTTQDRIDALESDTERLQGPCYEVDMKSAYPSVMRDCLIPIGLLVSVKNPTVREAESWVKSHCLLMLCEIEDHYWEYPLRLKHGVYYCRGKFSTWLCGREAQLALERNAVRQVYLLQVYTQDVVFRDFVDYWYGVRTSSDNKRLPAQSEFAKTIMNSFSAKWAQKANLWKTESSIVPCTDWGHFPYADSSTGLTSDARAIGGKVQILDKTACPRHCFPLVTACITAELRYRMDIVRRGLPLHTVLYQQTDSFIVTQRGLEAMQDQGHIQEGAIGKFSVKQMHERIEICGINFFRLENGHKIAGIPAQAVEVSPNRFVFTEWLSCDTQMQIAPTHGQLTRQIEKVMIEDYRPHVHRIGGFLEPIRPEDAFALELLKEEQERRKERGNRG